MSASNVSRTRSPTSSIRASSSRCAARACPTLLTVASSATRRCDSSMSRAFSSATLRLPASVAEQPLVGVREGMLVVEVLERDDATSLAGGDEGHAEPRLGRLPGQHRWIAIPLRLARHVHIDQERLAGLHHVPPEADHWHRLVGEAHAALDRVGKAQHVGRLVVDGDVDDLSVEDVPQLVADAVVEGLHVELAGDDRLDAVDDRELGIAPPGLLDRACARERCADVLPDEGEQRLVPLAVRHVLRVRLDDQGTHRPALSLERSAEPARVLRIGADDLDFALGFELLHPFVRQQLRLPGSEHVRGGPACVAGAERVPAVGVRHVEVQLVDVVRPADQLPLLVIERDEEVARVHQLADHAVHGPVELLHVLCGARQLGDSVEPGLDLVGVAALGLGCLELGQPATGRRQLLPGVRGLRHGNPAGARWIATAQVSPPRSGPSSRRSR